MAGWIYIQIFAFYTTQTSTSTYTSIEHWGSKQHWFLLLILLLPLTAVYFGMSFVISSFTTLYFLFTSALIFNQTNRNHNTFKFNQCPSIRPVCTAMHRCIFYVYITRNRRSHIYFGCKLRIECIFSVLRWCWFTHFLFKNIMFYMHWHMILK